MLKLLPVIISCIGFLATSAIADVKLKTNDQKASYVVGAEIGKQLLSTKDNIDLDALMLGINDLLSNKDPRLTTDEMRKAMTHYQNTKKSTEAKMLKSFLEKKKKVSDKFLSANKKKKGVVTLASGLQYKVVKSGKGKVHPKLTDTVVVHYHGKLLDGTVFDSSYERAEPISLPVNGVIKGWSEALMKMKAGDKWELVIPAKLAYGDRGAAPKIAPGATLLFDVELLEIK